MLVRCLYASRATPPAASPAPSETCLDGILKQSRKNNPAHGITGMLCYANDIFVQIIEGGRAEVGQLLTNLFKDPRHAGLQILSFEEIAERSFGHWTMGQVKISNINPALLLKYSERAELNPFACSGAQMLALLCEIAASGAIANRSL